MFSNLRVICAWCWKYLHGCWDCNSISHGICQPCMKEMLEQEESNPWSLWEDMGGSD
jgi:hypothetical protein